MITLSSTVLDLFREHARKNPDHTALVYEDVCLSYKEHYFSVTPSK